MSTLKPKHEDIIAKTDRIMSGEDRTSVQVQEIKDEFTNSLIKLTKRAKINTRRAVDTAYIIHQATRPGVS